MEITITTHEHKPNVEVFTSGERVAMRLNSAGFHRALVDMDISEARAVAHDLLDAIGDPVPQEGGQLPAEYARKDEAKSAHVMRLLHTLGYAHVTCHYVVQVSDEAAGVWLDALPTDRANVYVTRNGAVNGSVYAAARAKHGDSVRIIKRLAINFPGEA